MLFKTLENKSIESFPTPVSVNSLGTILYTCIWSNSGFSLLVEKILRVRILKY